MSTQVDELNGRPDAYAGKAQLVTDDSTLTVEVTLRGHFEPLDGKFHWFGRIAADPAIAEQHRSGTTLILQTPHGRAVGRISDVDPWGRFRIAGTGTPPF